jgi:preprotein translocase subunit YajC
MSLLVPLVLFGLLWALLILPQQRRMRAQQEMQNNLAPGDELVTAGGVYGRVTEVDSESVFLEVAEGIELRVAKSAVARRLPAQLATTDEAAEAEVDEFDLDLDGDTTAPAIPPPDGPDGQSRARRDDG